MKKLIFCLSAVALCSCHTQKTSTQNKSKQGRASEDSVLAQALPPILDAVYPFISVSELQAKPMLSNPEVVTIDLRTPEEVAAGYIDGGPVRGLLYRV